ncbi:MAG: CDP-alcohol phosphatidyltransferase family protein [Polaribacter sp.]
MNIKKHVPNLLTLGNLFCGTVATIFAVQGEFVSVAFLVVLGILFDFLDGFVARLLHISGELGKQLDSLADMVTSGVVPGIVMFQLIGHSGIKNFDFHHPFKIDSFYQDIRLLGLLLTLAACYRLAKFNIDTRQTDSFIGLPTPAMSLFVISLPLIVEFSDYSFAINLIQNNYFLVGITLVLSFLMNAELPLFSLKFKEYSVKNNLLKYVFLLATVILIFTLQYLSIPLIIVLYVVLSIVNNYGKK